MHRNRRVDHWVKNIHGIRNNDRMQVNEAHRGGKQEIKCLIINLWCLIICVITINILIGATILKSLTDTMCQTKYNRVMLEITIEDMVVKILIYKNLSSACGS